MKSVFNIDKEIDPRMIRNVNTLYPIDNIEYKNFNREVLRRDLQWLKYRIKRLKKIHKITKLLITELDKYFDKICPMAGLDSEPFKYVARKVLL
jgi:hypothetical protein